MDEHEHCFVKESGNENVEHCVCGVWREKLEANKGQMFEMSGWLYHIPEEEKDE